MTEIDIFSFSPDGDTRYEVRTVIGEDGEPWFVAKDVAEVLRYAHAPAAIRAHVDDEDKSTVAIRHSASETRATVINESGVYALIFRSKLPAARAFKRWVTSEVLPTIRREGGYISPTATADQVTALSSKLDRAIAALEAAAPKVRERDARKGARIPCPLREVWVRECGGRSPERWV